VGSKTHQKNEGMAIPLSSSGYDRTIQIDDFISTGQPDVNVRTTCPAFFHNLKFAISCTGFLPEFIPTNFMPLAGMPAEGINAASENGSAVSRWETGMTRQVDYEKLRGYITENKILYFQGRWY
jgi:hypothetical protein